ncbi:hypothetical protein ACSBR2_041963 [Camellia fascicularis]
MSGNEAEVVEQIIQMENEDIDRVKGQEVGPVRSLWHIDSVEFMAMDADGSAGGLLCIWNPETFSLNGCCCSRSFILLEGTMHSSLNCVVGNIYAPNEDVNRRRLWSTLGNLKSVFPNPWCLGGDFNEPILMMEDDRNWGPKPFKFINAWLLHPNFLHEVRKVWDSTRVHGWASYIIMEKLRALKVALKRWNVEVFGDVDSNLKEAESELHALDLQS